MSPLLFIFLLLLPSLSTSILSPTSPIALPGSIYRTTKQQILASVPPETSSPSPPVPFLTSPSGKFTALLHRTPTAPGAGGFGNDFCTIQIQETETSQVLWESECGPVSTSNTCTLVFDDAGLEVFDGSNSVYNTQADGNHVNVIELLDRADMMILDKDGELSWKASDEPRNGQGCGLPGSVGLAPETPPFAGVIGSGTGPFGQPVVGFGQGQVVGDGGEEGIGYESQYGSGTVKSTVGCLGFRLVLGACLFVIGV